jgi:hypothetical protein
MDSKRVYYTLEEDCVELTIELSAIAHKTDYGVARSPVWWEIDGSSIEIEGIEFYGETFTPQSFKEVFKEDTFKKLYENTLEKISDDIDDWSE